MSRTARQHTKPHKQKGRRGAQEGHEGPLPDALIEARRSSSWKAPAPLEARSAVQGSYMKAILAHQLVFGTGPAGTGKTYIPAALAADALREKRITKLILTRPAVEAGEQLGFLPGTIEEKYEPYLRPFRDALTERLGRGFYEYALKAQQIEPLPLAYMRGMTFPEGTWVILDEAQNVSPVQMKMFLTRIGEGSKIVVTGDPTQKDIGGPSGLRDAMIRMKGLPGSSIVRFAKADIVRSGMVQDIIERYETPEEEDAVPVAGLRKTLARGRASA